jgi:hypothetical protein
MASRLNLDATEIDQFLQAVVGGHRTYALDLTEVMLRLAARSNSADGPGWDFFDTVTFAHNLLAEVMGSPPGDDAGTGRRLAVGRRRILDALTEAGQSASDLADQICLIYEETWDQLNQLTADWSTDRLGPEAAPARSATLLLEDSWRQAAPAWPDDLAGAQVAVRDWALQQGPLFQAAYLSWYLTVLRLLVDHILDFSRAAATTAGGPPLLTRFYYLAARAASADPGFPSNLAEMADILWYEEGENLDERARKVCLVYIGRLLDVPGRVSRGRLAEFYLLTRSHHGSLPELNFYLQRHGFTALSPDDGWLPALLADQVRQPAGSPEVFAAQVAAASGNGAGGGIDKLFRWKYGSGRS